MPLNFDLQKIKDTYNCNIYFETGLWNVDLEDTSLCKAMRMNFSRLYSVEINKEFIDICKNKFKESINNERLKLFEGNSKNLQNYLSEITVAENDRIVFFLDSHGHGYGCPLIEELTAIKNMNFVNKPIIILDDVRIIRDCVWSDNRYDGSNFETILKNKILEIDPNYKFSYLDGVIKDDCLLCSF